ncbi:HAMP domain-containing histidine kinase [Lachnospiraceae bacterium ASD3451]|uniref:sensor histidine kinase n=1 Tax=Diplocloster agilis TaxID=2850323 RepID=UPI001DB68A41|nr:HAMP domain-containing sensor histidine kinase [Diplocloster agilis]MBU9742862.1 HAMP domain-containing histidine kinase [Diplocloster agilis]
MKFSTKLILSMTILVAVLFSVGGTILISRNFKHSLETAAAQNVEQHLLERYAIESNMINYILSGESYSEDKVADYAKRLSGYTGGQNKVMALYSDAGKVLYTNLPPLSDKNMEAILSQEGNTYLIRQADGLKYMLLTSQLEIDKNMVLLVSAYDITGLFSERDRQLQDFLLLDGIVILLCVLAIGLMTHVLTGPIQKLNNTSLHIANGAYKERTRIRSSDEIGQLSRNFDLMADAIEQQIDELQLSVRQRDDFINAFSHEIKTPMTAIIGYADILRTSATDKEKQIRYSRTIYQESRRLEELSRKLMDLMFCSEENLTTGPQPVYTIVHRLHQQMEPLLEGIRLSIAVEPASVVADASLLDCLLRNLILNAKKADPKDRTIELYGKIKDQAYRFSVEDSGCGIPPEELARITEPFYMIDKSRSRAMGGSGLGLFICSKIADLHHTKLHFESELGIGTTVWFELEVAKDV